MGSTFIKDQRIILLILLSVIFLSVGMSSATVVKNSRMLKKNHCRTHIFSPVCRGQQKRDILSRFEDYRVPTLDNDFSGNDRPRDLTNIFNSPTLLGELLKKTIEASPEYDSENGNYLK